MRAESTLSNSLNASSSNTMGLQAESAVLSGFLKRTSFPLLQHSGKRPDAKIASNTTPKWFVIWSWALVSTRAGIPSDPGVMFLDWIHRTAALTSDTLTGGTSTSLFSLFLIE